jgi:Cd2+/Zn2+-exporting ATPase
MSSEVKEKLIPILLSSVLLLVSYIIQINTSFPLWVYFLIYLIPFLIVGFDVIKESIEKLFRGDFLDEDFLMSIATITAMLIGFLPNSEPMFPEAVFVMLFFKVGELFEEIAEGKSEKSINELLKLRPDIANLAVGDEVKKVNPEEVKIGDYVFVYPGEKVPLDGVIVEGSSTYNSAALTGESVPVSLEEGDTVLAGYINLSGVVKFKVSKEFGESSYSKIIRLVKEASDNKSKSEKFITKFSKVYTPLVVILAIVISFVPPFLQGDFLAYFPEWLVRGLTFLVVSCPCALVISVPLAFFGGIGALSKQGILVKGSSYIEDVCNVKNIVFDKTGTLTKGTFEVSVIHPNDMSETELLHLSAHVERFSKHPIAVSLKQAYPHEDDGCEVSIIEDMAGYGIIANVSGKVVAVGNHKLMEKLGVSHKDCPHSGTIVHVAINNKYAGHIVVSDVLKDDSITTITKLEERGLKSVMLTGDHKEVAESISDELGIKEYYYDLLPEDKLSKLDEIKNVTSQSTMFVGDGINDAPVIAKADVGVAMGAVGQDAAIEIADVVLMDDKPSKILNLINGSKKIVKIAYQNIILAIVIKILVLILASLGYAPMWLAIFADVGVTVIAVLNSMRTLKL